MSPALAGEFFTISATWEVRGMYICADIQWNIAICSNMDGPREYYSEVSQIKTNTM